MQKVLTIRASQNDLNKQLDELTKKGYKVISVAKGSEFTQLGFSYKWTVVLEIPDDVDMQKAEKEMQTVKNNSLSNSCAVTVFIVFLALAVFTVSVVIALSLIK